MVPSFNDFYNFNVGDIFEYLTTYYQQTPTNYSTYYEWWDYKYTIQSKTLTADTITYGITVLEKATLWTYYGFPHNIVYTNYPSTLRFINSNQSCVNFYNDEADYYYGYYGGYYQKMYLYIDNTFQANGKGFNQPANIADGDTLGFNQGFYNYTSEYAANRGLVDWNYYVFYVCCDYSNDLDSALVGCKVNGITYGTLHTDSYMTGVDNISSLSKDIFVFPNPASNNITIQQSINTINSNLKINDVFGREIYKENLLNTNTKIDVSKWSAGVYFYKIISDNETVQGKFIKE